MLHPPSFRRRPDLQKQRQVPSYLAVLAPLISNACSAVNLHKGYRYDNGVYIAITSYNRILVPPSARDVFPGFHLIEG